METVWDSTKLYFVNFSPDSFPNAILSYSAELFLGGDSFCLFWSNIFFEIVSEWSLLWDLIVFFEIFDGKLS